MIAVVCFIYSFLPGHKRAVIAIGNMTSFEQKEQRDEGDLSRCPFVSH